MTSKLVFILCFLLMTFSGANAQIITTFAGDGSASYGGDGGAATAAQLYTPVYLAIDAGGNVFISTIGDCRVRKVDPSGIITTIAGTGMRGYSGDGGPATAAQFNDPQGIAIDGIGNVYIVDGANNRIRKVDVSGTITTYAGTGSVGFSGDGGQASLATLYKPAGVAVDFGGNIYIGDCYNHRVRKVSISGIITTVAGNGSAGYSGDGSSATAAQLHGPTDLAFDGSGNIFIADHDNHCVRRVAASGIITTIAGMGSAGFSGDGGNATAAQLHSPEGVSVDGSGNVYISDAVNYRVRVVDSRGIITTFAGDGSRSFGGDGGPATAAHLSTPVGVASCGAVTSVYVCDVANYRIRKIQLTPTFSADSFNVFLTKTCSGPQIAITTGNFVSGSSFKTIYGDGTSYTDTLSALSGGGYASGVHAYSNSGTYSIKHILYYGSVAVDSIQYAYNHLMCNDVAIQLYVDANSNCAKDSSERTLPVAVEIEVDSNGIAIDTVSATGGLYYSAYGVPGDAYAFRVLGITGGLFASCPSSGIVYDTLSALSFSAPQQAIGFSCSAGGALYDLAIYPVIAGTGRHQQNGNIFVRNNNCQPVNATVSVNYSPQYNGTPTDIHPSTSTVYANSINWNLSGLSSVDGVKLLSY